MILALPDISTIWRGGVIGGSPYGWNALFSLGLPYGATRLRGFTQEPSYLGMVISMLYPITLCASMRNLRSTGCFW